MSIQSELNRSVTNHARKRMDSAGRRMEFIVRDDAPEDTGRLKQGVKVGPTRSTGNVLTAEITSNAVSDEGTDYPVILNVMRRIALPMLGGMTSTLLLTLVVIPVVYYLWVGSRLTAAAPSQASDRTKNSLPTEGL